jgi:hypothetical protein
MSTQNQQARFFAQLEAHKRILLRDTPGVQRLLRDIAGHNLSAAAAFLKDLAEFEKEERQ